MICTRLGRCSVRCRTRAPVPRHASRPLAELASRRVVRAASQGTPDQLPDPAVLTALEHYGALAKAAYIMFENNTAHDADIKGRKMSDVVASDEPGLDVLAGYTGVSVISGFPGDVVLDPESVGPPAFAKIAKKKPSFLGFIAERAGADGAPELVVAFRGSEGRDDWLSNILGGATKDLYGKDGGRTHRGFYNILGAVPKDYKAFDPPLQTIDKALAAYTTPPRIITTGHSLGGALAILAAATIAHKRKEFRQSNDDYEQRLLQSYTFAAPRVGDTTLCNYFADQLQYKAVQMKNKQDAVPDLAPGAWGEVPGTIEKALGMIGAPKPTAGKKITAPQLAAGNMGAQLNDLFQDQDNSEGFSSDLQDRLHAYKELADMYPDQGALEKAISHLEEPSQASQAAVGAREFKVQDLGSTLRYAGDLARVLHTQWSDNPGAPFFVFDADEAGKWGGRKHSLEVYLKHIKNCNTEGR